MFCTVAVLDFCTGCSITPLLKNVIILNVMNVLCCKDFFTESFGQILRNIYISFNKALKKCLLKYIYILKKALFIYRFTVADIA